MLTGGAGARALALAFEEEFGIANGFDAIGLAGRTDAWLIAQAASAHHQTCDAERLRRCRTAYLRHLGREIHQPGPRKGVMPGVTALLEALSRQPDAFFLSLLSGNFEEGARTKLEYFDLWRYFRCGTFGDETLDRNALLPTALARAAECGYSGNDPAKIVVVGDTPLDIAVARAGGVRSLAVATGSCDRATLAAAGADVVLEDFSDLAATIAALEREAD